jgi:hypothetical protein
MKYTGRCQNDFNDQGYCDRDSGGRSASTTTAGTIVAELPDLGLGAPGGHPSAHLGFGRIVASETEAPDMLVILV